MAPDSHGFRRAMPALRFRQESLLLQLFLGSVLVSSARGAPQSSKLGFGSGQKASGASTGGSSNLNSMLEPGPDPRDPHADGFEPRSHEGADLWAFGRAHATLHHVLEHSPEGNATAAVEILEAFSAQHGLRFGLDDARGQAVERAVHTAATMATLSSVSAQSGVAPEKQRGLHVLVLGAGLGGSILRCLPALLSVERTQVVETEPHEVVSVEDDPHLSSGSAQLVRHALGRTNAQAVHFTPLLPGDETILEETLETLSDGYDLSTFDVVLLESGNRVRQREQLAALFRSGAMHHGMVIHAEGPGQGHPETKGYLEDLHWSKGASRSGDRFDTEIHDVGNNAITIVSVLHSEGTSSEL